MKAIELSGHIDERDELHLDGPLGLSGPCTVRVLVLVADDAEISEAVWRRAAVANPTLAFLHDPAEDIYSPSDGKPLRREG